MLCESTLSSAVLHLTRALKDGRKKRVPEPMSVRFASDQSARREIERFTPASVPQSRTNEMSRWLLYARANAKSRAVKYGLCTADFAVMVVLFLGRQHPSTTHTRQSSHCRNEASPINARASQELVANASLVFCFQSTPDVFLRLSLFQRLALIKLLLSTDECDINLHPLPFIIHRQRHYCQPAFLSVCL